jgi:cbb3-type cytochrome oxidase subunit 1
MIASTLLRISVSLALVGLAMGIGMGISQDHKLMGAHSHLNLVGFVTLFLAGLYYQAVPSAASSSLATVHCWVAAIGAVIFPVGIATVLLGGVKYEPFAIAGALVVFAAMALFTFIVLRNGAPQRV